MRWNIAIALLITAAPLALRAQESTVFTEDDAWKLYTTPQVSLTQIGGAESVLGGLGIGTILDDQWRFGITTRFEVDDVTTDNGELSLSTWDYWDVGGDFGYIFAPAELFHVDAGLYVGAGRIQRSRGDDRSDFAVIEPSVAACLNLHETWELGLRVGYRYTDGFDLGSLDDSDLREPILTLFVRATQF